MENETTEVVQPHPSQQSPKQSNKGLLGLLIGLGVLGMLLLIGLIIYFTVFHISKADYNRAATQANTVIDTYNKLSDKADEYATMVEQPTATDQQVAEKKAAFQSTYESYRNGVKSLANERAMKNDKVKAAYDKFVAKNRAFDENNASMVATMVPLRKVAVNCSESKLGSMDTNDLSKLVVTYDAAAAPCVDSMKELSRSKNVDAAKIGTKAIAYFAEMRANIVNMQSAYTANDRAKFETEYNAFMDKANSFDTDTEITSIQKHQDSLAPTDQLNNLRAVIDAQM